MKTSYNQRNHHYKPIENLCTKEKITSQLYLSCCTDSYSKCTNIRKLAHIRMDFRGIMQSAWTRKG